MKLRLNGSNLKWIAVVSMLIDHIGAVVIYFYLNHLAGIVTTQTEIDFYFRLKTVYTVFRYIGRLAFPIYCFLLVEGFLHTHSLKKYFRNLGLLAVISEVPFDLAFKNTWLDTDNQNVFVTLFLGLFLIWMLKEIENIRPMVDLLRIAATVGVLILAYVSGTLAGCDYKGYGVVLICILFLCRRVRFLGPALGTVELCLASTMEITCFLDVFLLDLYDGTRGKQKKYFFYFFYPVHLILLYLVRVWILKI